jgi:tetratricopeptide (TPR) repeat protein
MKKYFSSNTIKKNLKISRPIGFEKQIVFLWRTGLFMIFICSFFVVFSCNEKEKKGATDKKNTVKNGDSTLVFNHFPDASILSDDKEHTAYLDFLSRLLEKENYKLLKEHITHYQSLSEESKTVVGISNLYLGYLFNQDSNLDSAQVCFETAIKNLGDKKYIRELYLAYAGNATNYSYLQQFDNAIKMHYKVLDLLQKSNIKEKERKYYEELGNLGQDFTYAKNYDKAITLIDSSLSYFTKLNDIKNIANLESVKSVILFKQKKDDESIKSAKHSLELRTILKDVLGQAESNNNIALAYFGKSKWQDALGFLEKAKSLYIKGNDYSQMVTIQNNIGRCLQKMGKIDEAIRVYEENYVIADKKNKFRQKGSALKSLSELYKQKGNFEKSLELYVQYSNNNNIIYTSEKEKTIQDVFVKYETKQKEQRIISLQKDKQLASKQRWIYIILILSLIIIGLFSTVYFVLRNRKNKELLESNQKLFESEMERNRNELDHFTDKLLSKSKLIDELEEKLNLSAANETEVKEFEQINQLTKMRILTEDNWALFKEHFDKVYPSFIPFIRNKYNNLTPAELRTLLLIKLNIESNEIAAILGISLDSVRKSRYRLKKKLDLQEEDDLIQHVQNLVC